MVELSSNLKKKRLLFLAYGKAAAVVLSIMCKSYSISMDQRFRDNTHILHHLATRVPLMADGEEVSSFNTSRLQSQGISNLSKKNFIPCIWNTW